MGNEIMGDWVTVRRAAAILGVSKQRVHQLMEGGLVGWVRFDKMLLVRKSSVVRRKTEMEERRES